MTTPASAWFRGAGLGPFVHWDHASQQGLELSWPLVGGIPVLPKCQSVPVATYHASAPTFDPTACAPRACASACTSRCRIGTTPTTRRSVRRTSPTCFSRRLRGRWPTNGLDTSISCAPKSPSCSRTTDRSTLLWFDGGWERPADWWKPAELEQMIRSLQPEILINDRLPMGGDFETPEQFVPAVPPERPWETCLTMNESWGYNPSDGDYKSRSLIHTICEVAARGGNLLLNVSPTGAGGLPPEQVERLDAVARWMRTRSRAVTVLRTEHPWWWWWLRHFDCEHRGVGVEDHDLSKFVGLLLLCPFAARETRLGEVSRRR